MLIAAVLAFALQESPASALQEPAAATAQEPARSAAQRIAWYTSLDQAMADGERLNRPILLQSAAPQCGGVPGMW